MLNSTAVLAIAVVGGIIVLSAWLLFIWSVSASRAWSHSRLDSPPEPPARPSGVMLPPADFSEDRKSCPLPDVRP
jgi:hypothetical protein